MTSFDRFAFALNEQNNCHVVNAANRVRQQSFTMWINFYEIITLSSFLSVANLTRSTSKRFLNDIIDIANNDVASKRRRERSVKSKDDQRISSINVVFALYNLTSSVAITIFSRQESRQEKRRFARLASRVSLFSQSLSQEDDDDDEFDDLFLARFYVNLNDQKWENEIAIKHAFNEDQKKKSRLLNRRDKKTYARKIVRQRVRIRRFDLKIRRDDKNLNSDYMIARKKNVIFEKHVLFEFQNDHNVCSFCDAYQYDEECHNKFFDDKYWHCCVNDKISFDMMTFEANFDVVTKLLDDFDKNVVLQRDENFKYLDYLLWEMRSTDDSNSRKRLSKRCKKFQKMTITFNNVLSFISESAKMNKVHNVWITFRIMKSIHHMLNALLVDSNDRRRFCQIFSFDSSQKILLKRLIHDEQLFEKTFHKLQNLMIKYNSYVQLFKSCDDRLKNDDFEIKIVLKQHDLKRMLKDTHNKLIFEKIVVVLSVLEMSDSNKSIEKDIVIQTYDDDLIRIFY